MSTPDYPWLSLLGEPSAEPRSIDGAAPSSAAPSISPDEADESDVAEPRRMLRGFCWFVMAALLANAVFVLVSVAGR